MKFTKTALEGVEIVDLEVLVDDRGFFARAFCEEQFAAEGLDHRLPQWNLSYNAKRGTLRGMHYEVQPTQESKLVRCGTGAIYDVVVDLRHRSPTFLRWVGIELSRENRRALCVPAGCAHGFLTLSNDVDVWYGMGSSFRIGAGRGMRWDDPIVGIDWPFAPTVISERDASYPNYDDGASPPVDR